MNSLRSYMTVYIPVKVIYTFRPVQITLYAWVHNYANVISPNHVLKRHRFYVVIQTKPRKMQLDNSH